MTPLPGTSRTSRAPRRRTKERSPRRSPNRSPNRRRRAARVAKPRPRLSRPGRGFWIGLLVAIGGVGAGVGVQLGWRALAAHPALAIREIEIAGAVHASEEELRELAGIAVGDRWLDLDSRDVSFRLRAHAWVAQARVRRPGPGRVRLEIVECVPVARVRVSDGTYGVCRDLRVVPAAPDESTLPLIAVAGPRRRAAGADPEALARGVEYVTALEALGLAGDGAVEVVVGEDGDRIRFPRLGFDVKIEVALPAASVARNTAAFLERLDARGASRGTLRLISEETAVWKAAA